MFDINRIVRSVVGAVAFAAAKPTNNVWHTGDVPNGILRLTGLEVGDLHDGQKGTHIQGNFQNQNITTIVIDNGYYHDMTMGSGQHTDAININGSLDPKKPTTLVIKNTRFRGLASGILPVLLGGDRFFDTVTFDGCDMDDSVHHDIQVGSITANEVIFTGCVGLQATIDPGLFDSGAFKKTIKKVTVINCPGAQVTPVHGSPAITWAMPSKPPVVPTPVPVPVPAPDPSWADVRAFTIVRGPGVPLVGYMSDPNGLVQVIIPVGLPGGRTKPYLFRPE